jgi:outer membrane protein OmpA-like peptidoglycan-associated protein/tetratricopeptide (TPR) repeat protein
VKKLYITCSLLAACLLAQAGPPSKADKYYERYDYFKAAELYKREAAKHPSQDLNYKLGVCYQKMNKYQDAEASYKKVLDAGPYANPEFYLNYGLVLKNDDKCEASKYYFRKYDSLVPADPRGKLYMNSCDVLAEDHKYDLPIGVANVKALNTRYSDFGAVKYKDGIVFTSSRRSPTLLDRQIDGWTGGFYTDIYYARKGKKNTDFGMANRLEENMVDLNFHDGPATFSKNFDTIYISRATYDLPAKLKTEPGVDRIKIYYAKVGEYKWNGMDQASINSNYYSVADPALSADGKRLYFASDMPGGFGASDIYYCTREGAGWSKPIHLGPEVNTAGREVFPYSDSLGNLYFSSDGFGAFGGLDICVALNKGGNFETAKPMKAPFNSSADDFGISFLKTGKAGYMSSNRSGGAGDDDIYYFDLDQDSLDKKVNTSIYTIGYRPMTYLAKIHVSILEEPGRKPIEDGKLDYRNPLTMQIEALPFDSGRVEFKVPAKTHLVMDITPKGYDTRTDSIEIPVLKNDTTINLVYTFSNSHNRDAESAPLAMYFDSKNIFFDFDKYAIRSNEINALDSVARYMKNNPDLKVEIDAHADSRGTAEYNYDLSLKRAASAIKYLHAQGIEKKRMKPVGYGSSKPFNRCSPGVECSEEEHQANRRVVFKFSAPQKPIN